MSRRLLQLVIPVFPDRCMFRIHDPEVNPYAPGGPPPPGGMLISASREQLWVGSLQQDIGVRLVLEEWDGQPLLPDAWDDEAKGRLFLRGQLSIDMGSAGMAVQRLRLSGGVGSYAVRVYARYREAVVRMYQELFNAHRDPLSDEFQREKRRLEGIERYLIQLWRDSLADGLRPGGYGAAATGLVAPLAAAPRVAVLTAGRVLVPDEALPGAAGDDVPVAAEEVFAAGLPAAGLRVPGVTPKSAAVPGTAGVVLLVVCVLTGVFDVCVRNGIIT